MGPKGSRPWAPAVAPARASRVRAQGAVASPGVLVIAVIGACAPSSDGRAAPSAPTAATGPTAVIAAPGVAALGVSAESC